mmetsp:Transcript_16977/g.46995  ORF Transcript_16977/g.46995 Transcript_16977/m.46995 type:complete len:232 (+) Transcript_16977:275-970(+)
MRPARRIRVRTEIRMRRCRWPSISTSTRVDRDRRYVAPWPCRMAQARRFPSWSSRRMRIWQRRRRNLEARFMPAEKSSLTRSPMEKSLSTTSTDLWRPRRSCRSSPRHSRGCWDRAVSCPIPKSARSSRTPTNCCRVCSNNRRTCSTAPKNRASCMFPSERPASVSISSSTMRGQSARNCNPSNRTSTARANPARRWERMSGTGCGRRCRPRRDVAFGWICGRSIRLRLIS